MIGNWLKGAELRRIDLELYVKWILWRDNMIDKLRRRSHG